MKKNIKRLAFLGVFSIAAVTLTACSSSNGGASNSGAKVTTVKIAWRGTGQGDPIPTIFNQSWINSFEKTHKDIKVELDPITCSEGDYPAKIELAMKSSSTTPDILNEDTFLLPSDAAAGYLTPLNSYLKNWSDWKEFNPALIAGSQGADGKQYGIPGTTDSRGIYVDISLLKKAGLPANWQPKTWQDVLDFAKKVKQIDPTAVPLAFNYASANGEATSMQTFEQLLYGTGETLYNEKTDKWNVNSQGILNSFKFINQVMNVDKTGAPLALGMNSTYGATINNQMFPQNQVGMSMDGIWTVANWSTGGAAPIADLTSKVEFALMPTENGQGKGYVTMSGGWAWSIPSKSVNKTADMEVLEAMTTEQMQAKRNELDGTLTTRLDSAKEPAYAEKPFIAQATKALNNAFYRPKSVLYPKVSLVIQNTVESVATGKATPEQAAATYASQVEQIVGKDHTETQK